MMKWWFSGLAGFLFYKCPEENTFLLGYGRINITMAKPQKAFSFKWPSVSCSAGICSLFCPKKTHPKRHYPPQN